MYSRAFSAMLFTFLCLNSQFALSNTEIDQFTIKPKICVVEKEQVCEREFIFYWRLSQSNIGCLYHENRSKPIYCQKGREVEITKTINLVTSNQFTLKVGNSSTIETVRIRQLTTDVRQVRRHLWSVF